MKSKQRPASFWYIRTILALSMVIFYPALKLLPYRQALTSAREMIETSVRPEPPLRPRRELKVWVAKRTGLYYCPSSPRYASFTPGEYMRQDEALQAGFRPAPNAPCT